MSKSKMQLSGEWAMYYIFEDPKAYFLINTVETTFIKLKI